MIADPNRRRILDTLRDGAADVGSLVERLAIGVQAPWRLAGRRHRRLEVDGKLRIYRLADDPLPAVLAWVTPYHRKWSAGLERLSQLIDEEET